MSAFILLSGLCLENLSLPQMAVRYEARGIVSMKLKSWGKVEGTNISRTSGIRQLPALHDCSSEILGPVNELNMVDTFP
ncbi:hypothetical protein EDB19DRAFT_1762225 [Suillus lakei]|nr:hypothetical protein EDB19DRAFT_1762225 [Suillus lakei]